MRVVHLWRHKWTTETKWIPLSVRRGRYWSHLLVRISVKRLLARRLAGYQRSIRTRETLHPIPYTLHPAPYTLHHAPFTLHPTPCTLHPSPYTLHRQGLRAGFTRVGRNDGCTGGLDGIPSEASLISEKVPIKWFTGRGPKKKDQKGLSAG